MEVSTFWEGNSIGKFKFCVYGWLENVYDRLIGKMLLIALKSYNKCSTMLTMSQSTPNNLRSLEGHAIGSQMLQIFLIIKNVVYQ